MSNIAIVITVVLLLQLSVAEVRNRKKSQCGVPQIKTINLIHHGNETVPGAWSWHAAIIHRKGGQESYVCGGTLITKRYVLTAAHCLMDEDQHQLSEKKIFIRLGIHNLRQMGFTLQNHSVAKIYTHPNYTSPLVWDDIGILELQTQAKFNDYVQLACLGLTYDLTGIYGTVIGWGRTEEEEYPSKLKSSRMPVIDVYTCLASDRETYGLTLTKNILCAGYTNGTKVCNGDSGSGLFFQHNNAWFLGGIVSFTAVYLDSNGYHVCNKNGYGAFTNVHSYQNASSTLAIAQLRNRTKQYHQITTTPAPEEDETILEDCSKPLADESDSAEFDKWECVCRKNGFARDTCEHDIKRVLQNDAKLKLCRDTPHLYLTNNLCHYERDWELSDDSTGKAMQFAVDLFKATDPRLPNENVVISPLSMQVLLAQLIDGCSESARKEMIETVKLNSGETSMLIDALTDTANKDSTANKLDIASMFFLSKNVNLTANFNAAREESYIPLQEIDFSNTNQAVETVNSWATEKTRGKIPKVVTKQSLSPDMSILLLNAIYFKGTWQYKFNQTQTNNRATFETAENQKMYVHMMSQTNQLRFGEISFGEYSDSSVGLRWVELPYDGNQLSMIFFLPKIRHSLDEVLESVNGTHLTKMFKVIKRDYNSIKIHLKVPRFTIDNSVSLVEPLKKLGLKQIFEQEDALSALSNTPTKVGDVKQNAYFSVDEAGTLATAVIKRTFNTLASNEDINFLCDEPFMVMVVDKTNEIPLFMAKIKQPYSTS